MYCDGTDVTLTETEVEYATCRVTGAPTTLVSGQFSVGALSAGWYSVGVTHGRPDRLPQVRIFIGDWTEAAGPHERWGMRVGISRDGPVLLDWPEADRAEARGMFTPLDRIQILGTPMEPQLWSLLDLVLTQDSRL